MVNSKNNNNSSKPKKQQQQEQNSLNNKNSLQNLSSDSYSGIIKTTNDSSNRSKQKVVTQYSSENARKLNPAKPKNANNPAKPLKQRNTIVENCFINNANNNKSKSNKQLQQQKSTNNIGFTTKKSNDFQQNTNSSRQRSSKSYGSNSPGCNNSTKNNNNNNNNSTKNNNNNNNTFKKSSIQIPESKSSSDKISQKNNQIDLDKMENSSSDIKSSNPKNHNSSNLISSSSSFSSLNNIPCAKCSSLETTQITVDNTVYKLYEPIIFNNKQYRKSKSYVGSGHSNSRSNNDNYNNKRDNNKRNTYYRSYSDRRNSFDRHYAMRNKDFVPIVQPTKPILSSSNIAAVIADVDKLVIIERLGKNRTTFPIMQCGTLDAPDSPYHRQRSMRMDAYQIDDGFHSDGGTETPPPSPSSGSSIASTSDHGSLESVDTGGAQRLAVLSFEQVRKLHNVMDEKVAIHGRGNFPTLEVTLKDLVNSVRRKLEADVASGGAGVIVKDIRLNGGAASHVLAPEDQPYNDLDLIYAIELSSPRVFDRVKAAVLNTLLDLLPEGVSKRRIMPCALKEAYVGKMVKVNNNNDGDRWSLISLGNSPGHKNVELKFVDTMRRQFEFSVDSFQIVLDSLLLFYDCAALPISENFYPTVVGESVYGDFQEALYHLQKKLISTRQPEEIRGGGLLKYCNLLVRNYKPVDPQRIKNLERYMCSRFFIDFPDINTQTVKLEAYLRNHFWGADEEHLQYQYLIHLREVVEQSTVCLMNHERRQTLSLIQTLATQVRQRQAQQHQEQYQQSQQSQHQQHQHQQQQQQHLVEIQHHQNQQQQQPQQQLQTTAILVAQTHNHHQNQQSTQQQQQQQPQTATIYLQTSTTAPQNATLCCAIPTNSAGVGGGGGGINSNCCNITSNEPNSQNQAQTNQQHLNNSSVPTANTTAPPPPQTIQIQPGPGGLIYANGVYYAPVIPTICTCNSAWLST